MSSPREQFVKAMREMRYAFAEDKKDFGNDWGLQIVHAFADVECAQGKSACYLRWCADPVSRYKTVADAHQECRAALEREIFKP